MASKLNMGVIGLGWPGGQAIEGILENKGKANLVAIADPLAERVEQRRQELAKAGIAEPAAYQDAEALLEDENVDAVCIALPNFLHAPIALAALKQGKHVFTEKPPTLNAKEMAAVYREAKKRNLTYQYVCQRRFNESGRALRKAVESGKLGEVYHARAQWTRARGIPIGAGGWFVDKTRAGGGAIIDIGVHMLDAAWHYMGSPRPVSVSGRAVNKMIHLVPKKIKFDVDDFGIALIKFENDATILLETSWALNQRDFDRMGVELYGTRAGATSNPPALITYNSRNEMVEKPLPSKKNRKSDYGEMIQHFVQCCDACEEPVSSAHQALQLMQMLDAVYESSETGKEVRIKPVKD